MSVSQVGAGNVKYRCVITDAEGASVTSEECTVTWEDNGFLMYVEDVFSVQGRGTILTGKITYGEIKTNETVYIVSADGTKTEAKPCPYYFTLYGDVTYGERLVLPPYGFVAFKVELPLDKD